MARENGVRFINGSPFASGRLSGRDAPDWHPAMEAEHQLFREAAAFFDRRGVPISKLALQLSSQNPDIPTTLFSNAQADSICRNVLWHEETLDPDLLTDGRSILKPVMHRKWDCDAST